MQIGLLTDINGQRVWHRWLAAALAELGHSFVLLRPGSDAVIGLPASVQLAFWLDPIVFKLKGEHAFNAVRSPTIADESSGQSFRDRTFDVLINASSSEALDCNASRRLRLSFNDQPSELAAVNAALGAQEVIVTLTEQGSGPSETARPGIERRECLTCALDNVFSTVVELLVERISTPTTPYERLADGAARLSAPGNRSTGGRYVARALAAKVSNKASAYLNRNARAKSRWGVAARVCPDGDGLLEGAWPREATFDLVPDDGQRYYADPFVFSHGGRAHVFVEDYPFATARGIISVAELDENGRAGAFRPVLERGFHLSYPFVFTYDNDVWMIPEACESGAVDLYRAAPYPDQWVLDRRLLDGVPGCDATIIKFDGAYYMVLTATRWLGSTWDKQRVYHAQTPFGPWREIDGGLVRVDCTSARPAGAPVYSGDRVLRPAQDSSRGYGSSMTILEVQQLSPSVCSEIPIAKITARGGAGATFTHTYSRNGCFEVVDVYGAFSAAQRPTIACTPIVR